MIPHLVQGACLVASLSTDVDFDSPGWSQVHTVEVLPAPGCDRVVLDLPDGVELVALSGTMVPADRGRFTLDPVRFERTASRPDGTREWRVHLDDLAPGDRAILRVAVRGLRPSDLAWHPAEIGAAFGEIRLPRNSAAETVGLTPQKRWAWVSAPDAHDGLTLAHPWAERAFPPLPPMEPVATQTAVSTLDTLRWLPRAAFGAVPELGEPVLQLGATDDRGYARTAAAWTDAVVGRWSPTEAAPALDAPEVPVVAGQIHLHPSHTLPQGFVHTADAILPFAGQAGTPATAPPASWEAELVLELPPGDPRAALAPGGGARLRVVRSFDAPAGSWFVPMAVDATEVTVEGGRSRVGPGGVWVTTAAPARLVLQSSHPVRDAWLQAPEEVGRISATRAERAGAPLSARFTPDGPRHVVIAELDGLPLLTDRARLITELSQRYGALSYPEPALSQRLRGHRRGEELVGVLVDALRLRATASDDLPVPPTWPRSFHHARSQRLVSPLEAAWIVHLYARQAHMEASWALVRSTDGETSIVPAGFDDALAVIQDGDHTWWVDPGCTVCGLGEIRPTLAGAAAIGPGLTTTPALPPLQVTVTDSGATVRATLNPPAALTLRLWLASMPESSRLGALAARLGGPSADPASLVAEGLRQAGSPVTVSVGHGTATEPAELVLDGLDVWSALAGE